MWTANIQRFDASITKTINCHLKYYVDKVMFKLSASGLVFKSVDFIRERIRKVIKYIYQNDCNFFPCVCLFSTQ